MIDHAELFDALDALIAAEKEYRRQHRALFPAIKERRKQLARVLAVYRAMKAEPAEPPDADRPLIDAIDRATARARPVEPWPEMPDGSPLPAIVEERPDPAELVAVEEGPAGGPIDPPARPGRGKGRKRKPAVWVEEPKEGWAEGSLYGAAQRIAGRTEKAMLTAADAALTVLCNRCNAARHRTAGKCPQCGCPEYRAYAVALSEILEPPAGSRRNPGPKPKKEAAS